MKQLLITIAAVVLVGCAATQEEFDSANKNKVREEKISFTNKTTKSPVILPPSATLTPLTQIEFPTKREKSALINKKMTVFGIKVFALEGVTDRDLKLVANVLAQWVDNDENGTPDNPDVLAEIIRQKSRMILGVTFDQISPWHENSQKMLRHVHAPTYGLDVTTINHNWYGLPHSEYSQSHYLTEGLLPPDAATEETFHLITDIGYANVYPSSFWHGEVGDNPSTALRSHIAKRGEGQKDASLLTVAMDKARGGYFKHMPRRYPDNAWYTRSDDCSYKCFVGEYIHWGIITLLGYNEKRENGIHNQWGITNAVSFRNRDTALYELLTSVKYRFPKIAPDGSYGDLNQ